MLISPKEDDVLTPTFEEIKKNVGPFFYRNPALDTPNYYSPILTTQTSVNELQKIINHIYSAHIKTLNHYLNDQTHFLHTYLKHLLNELYFLPPFIDPKPLLNLQSTSACYGRPEFVIERNIPKLVETNFDVGIAGMDVSSDINQISSRLYFKEPFLYGKSLLCNLASWFDENFSGKNILWTTSPSSGRKIICDHLANQLNKLGHLKHVNIHPGTELEKLSVKDEYVLHRGSSMYTVKTHLSQYQSLLDSIKDRVKFITVDQQCGVISSKIFLAILADKKLRPQNLTADEIMCIEQNIPETRIILPDETTMIEEISNNKNRYVIKKADSFRGFDVAIGLQYTDTSWKDKIKKITSTPDYKDNLWIVQRYVKSDNVNITEISYYTSKQTSIPTTVGIFIYGGKVAGFQTFTRSEEMKPCFVPHYISND